MKMLMVERNLAGFSVDILKKIEQATFIEEEAFKGDMEIIKHDKYSYAGFLSNVDQTEKFFVKCYKPKNALNRALVRLGISRPHRSFNIARHIEGWFPISSPVALVINSCSLNTYYFSTHIDGDSMSDLVKRSDCKPEYREAVISKVGQQLAKFHQQGWLHGDLKWSNIVICGEFNVDINEVFFIDLDGAKPVRVFGKNNGRGRDLARFIVNCEDYHVDARVVDRFIDAYANGIDSSYKRCVRMAAPSLKKLRKRHDKKYGLRNKSSRY